MIYTVTFNPALDYVMRLDNLKEGKTNRSNTEELSIGGKGINVSVILTRLGLENTALGFVAGFTGEKVKQLANELGIKSDFITLPSGNTRINVKIKSDTETEIDACGPDIDKKSLDEFFTKLDDIKDGDALVLSGSVPQSLPDDIYEQIILKTSKKDIKVCVDATGDLLKNTLKYKPFVIKPNKSELEEIVRKRLNTLEEIVSAAIELKALGAQNVLVSMGGEGAVLVDLNNNFYFEEAKKIKPINTVGSGDSMLAGFIFGAQKDLLNGLKFGIAAGSATAASPVLATKKEILKLFG